MKNFKSVYKNVPPIFATVIILALSACAGKGMHGSTQGNELNSSGPTVIDARTNPGTFELNSAMQTQQRAEIIADVKDFNSDISDVKLSFLHVPMEIPMQKVSESTWRAELSAEQLKRLAVSGQTMKYQANVIAMNERGQTAVSKTPVQIAIRAPEVTQPSG